MHVLVSSSTLAYSFFFVLHFPFVCLITRHKHGSCKESAVVKPTKFSAKEQERDPRNVRAYVEEQSFFVHLEPNACCNNSGGRFTVLEKAKSLFLTQKEW